MKEISTLRASPPDGVRIVTNEEDMFDITGIVAGPGAYIFGKLCTTQLCLVCLFVFEVIWLTAPILVLEGTPYEGGYFKIRFQFTEEFPAAPPKCVFVSSFLARLISLFLS